MPYTGISLNVIGLISGGKDSFFSLLHCMANNHQVVALANLYPPNISSFMNEREDLNSFMYQTAGHGIIPLYSEALNLPLYRQVIQGSALNQAKEYFNTSRRRTSHESQHSATNADEDETESLMPLLRKVVRAHPTANAICSGAILSTYQRTRIESVARRLELVPLCYLWQYPSLPPPSPGGLLDDMAAAGFDIRLVKVASGGLDENLLWKNLTKPVVRAKVQKAVARFGGSVLGEGGEYETLVVDGSTPFWKKSIEIEPSERWNADGGGGEAWIGFTGNARLSLKREANERPGDTQPGKGIRIPGLWDREFEKLIKKIAASSFSSSYGIDAEQLCIDRNVWNANLVVTKSSSTLKIHNMTAPKAGTTASEQMLMINSHLLEILLQHGISNADNLVFATILLRRMADFAIVNEVYGQLFNRPNPPARVTVACGDTLPSSVYVMASFVICLEAGVREGLHVQSRSYWAPANIGPYSQAISVPLHREHSNSRLVYIAGQIPLEPATMEVLQIEKNEDEDENECDIGSDGKSILCQRQMCLALQHMWRIGEVMNVGWWTDAVAFIVGADDVRTKALIAWKIWEEVHQVQLWELEGQDEGDEGLESIDEWDRKYGGMGSFVGDQGNGHRLPDFKRFPDTAGRKIPYFFAVQVAELPRGCEVEWQGMGIASSDSGEPKVYFRSSFMAISWDAMSSDSGFRTQLNEILGGRQRSESFEATIYTPRPDLIVDNDVQIIPCTSVWGFGGTRLAAGIAMRYHLDDQLG